MIEPTDLVSFILLIPLFAVLIVFVVAIGYSVCEVFIVVINRLRWRLLDYINRNFFKDV